MESENDRIQRVWRNQIVAEYTSASITAELLHWLVVLGVSPDLIDLCRRIVDDELTHAADAREVYLAAGGDPARIRIEQERLWNPLARGRPLHERAIATAGRIFCCGETVAVPLFQAMAEKATEPTAVAMYARVARDEPVHSAFGWALLDALIELVGDEGARLATEGAPVWMEGTKDRATVRVEQPPLTEAQRAWGLIEPTEYSRIVVETIAGSVAPRFRKRGLVV